MKKLTFSVALITLFISTGAQHKIVDSLRAKLNRSWWYDTRQYGARVEPHPLLSNPDSNIIISQQVYILAEKYKLLQKQATALNAMSTGYSTLGDYPKAIQVLYRSLRIAENGHDTVGIARGLNNSGDTYTRESNYRKALSYLLPAERRVNI